MSGWDGSYTLTLRLMLAILRRKLSVGNATNTPQSSTAKPMPTDGSMILVGGAAGPSPSEPAAQAARMEDFGFVWPAEAGTWGPSNIPFWLQEAVSDFTEWKAAPLIMLTGWTQNLTDLGLPINGNDGVFLNSPHWAVDMLPMPEAR